MSLDLFTEKIFETFSNSKISDLKLRDKLCHEKQNNVDFIQSILYIYVFHINKHCFSEWISNVLALNDIISQ